MLWLLALIVLVPAAFAAFLLDMHLNNLSTIELNRRAAERDKLAAGMPSTYRS